MHSPQQFIYTVVSSYKAPIARGHLVMQEIKLTHIYPIITPSQDNCVRVNSIQNVCGQPFVRMSVDNRLFECLWTTVCSNVCG